MKTGFIYKLTAPNGKIYIGQSLNLYYRFNKYKNLHCKNQPKLYNSIKKYGWENFNIEIIEKNQPFDQLNMLEEKWIIHFDSISNGLNCSIVGTSIISDETRKKMSESAKGNSCAKGHKVSDQTREVLRQKALGNTHGKGKKRSEQTKELNRQKSIGNKNRVGAKSSEETKRLISISKNNKPIDVLDLNSNLLFQFENLYETYTYLKSLGYKIINTKIHWVCSGKVKSHCKLIFKYNETNN